MGRRTLNRLKLEFNRETDGKWIAEAPELPGVLAYGATPDEAKGHAMSLAPHVIADKIEHGEPVPAERLTTLDIDEWWSVARKLNPRLTREEFDRQWEEFQREKTRRELS